MVHRPPDLHPGRTVSETGIGMADLETINFQIKTEVNNKKLINYLRIPGLFSGSWNQEIKIFDQESLAYCRSLIITPVSGCVFFVAMTIPSFWHISKGMTVGVIETHLRALISTTHVINSCIISSGKMIDIVPINQVPLIRTL